MKTASLTLALAMLIAFATHADALPSYVPRIPNGANVPNVPAVGHADHTGASGDLDAFGVAFEQAGDKWTEELCKADSDGDGQTNGEELGDPCCEWKVGGTPKFTTGVSNPGDPSSKVSSSVLSSTSCSGSAATKTESKATDTTATASNQTDASPSSNNSTTASSGNATTPVPSATSGATSAPSAALTSLAVSLVALLVMTME